MINDDTNESSAPRQPIQAKLNVFQRTMLDWNDLHPYNAVHVARIPRPLGLDKLEIAVAGVITFHGLSGVTLDRNSGAMQYHSGAEEVPISAVPTAGDARETLRAEIERQINTAFNPSGRFLPFRFFAIPEPASFYFGLVYFHAVADAVSIVELLRQICRAYLGEARDADAKPFPPARPRLRVGPFAFARKFAGFTRQLGRHRHSVRVSHRNVFDGQNRFELITLDAETVRSLKATAKRWEITVNDVFLAVLLRCCSPFTLNRFQEPSRRRIAVGCIVNTRRELELEDPRAWGLFLGSFVVAHETPDGLPLRDLARDVRRQTLDLKRRKDYAASIDLALGRFLLSFFSTRYRTKLYQKYYPLWGGLTNMNLNELWPQPANEPAVDYVRGVSTGPVTPLVLGVTTVREVMNLGLSFRATTFTEANIAQVKKHISEILATLKS